MAKARRYQTVALREAIGDFPKDEVGAVVEVYTSPYEAYDIEIVSNGGQTKGLIEGVRPEQIELAPAAGASRRGRRVAASAH